MTKRGRPLYPCLGYCIIDARGYCVACGRPPGLGLPESCAQPTDAATTPGTADVPPQLPGKTVSAGE